MSIARFMTQNLRSLALGLGLILLPAALPAQNFTIDWYKMAGGGGASAQWPVFPDGNRWPTGCRRHECGQLFSQGGFWSIYAVQTPENYRWQLQPANPDTLAQ